MSNFAPLLIELGTEELPPKALPELAQAFFDGIGIGLEKRGIAFNKNNAKALYSPRRLAVLFAEVGTEQARGVARATMRDVRKAVGLNY